MYKQHTFNVITYYVLATHFFTTGLTIIPAGTEREQPLPPVHQSNQAPYCPTSGSHLVIPKNKNAQF